ncbi:MAG: PQQ-binding-like beta-propeller repeat protein, partial [Bacteroidales bacterium]|nr:PQQ-binding-like beta-propeller repeat protein [Bacteroidales bacterium]
LKAIDKKSGELLWNKKTPITPMTMAANDERVAFFDGVNMVSLDPETGNNLWENEVTEMDQVLTGYSGPRLIMKNGHIVFAPKDQLFTFSTNDGELVWSSEDKPRSGHFSLEDVYVIDDKVWVLGRENWGRYTTYDLKSGEELDVYENPISSFYIHQRCYPGRATEDFLFPPMMGVTGFDMKEGEWEINHWVRGGCIYGMMPANGLIYTPPHACACYYQSKLTGFNALTDKIQPAENITETERLQKGPAYGEVNAETYNPGKSWPAYRHDNGRSGYIQTQLSSDIRNSWKIDLDGEVSQPVVAKGKLFVSAVDEHTVYALDTDSGEELWHFTAGGRIDSPPTIYNGMALFGCSDGSVYAVRTDDGQLVWRYQVAPNDRKIMSYGQLESAWPISGSVLVEDDKLYCVAGRSMFLDGGLQMAVLNPQTGEMISKNVMDSKVPGSDKNLQDLLMGKHMPVAQPDILSSDGKYIYMRSQTFNKDGKRVRVRPQRPDNQYGEEVHLFSPTSFLDDSWQHRTYWLYGRVAGEGWAEFQLPPKRVPYGRIMCLDEENAYSYGLLPELLCNTSINEYKLYSANKIPERKVGIPSLEGDNWPEGKYDTDNGLAAHTVNWKKLDAMPKEKLTALDYNWEMLRPDIMARAMVLAGDKLFLAGPKDIVDEKEMWGRSNEKAFQEKMQEQTEWLKGKNGAFIWVVSKKDGERLARYKIDCLPAHDGLIAAEDKLYMVSEKGEIFCYEGE